jgi:hypothetical protein
VQLAHAIPDELTPHGFLGAISPLNSLAKDLGLLFAAVKSGKQDETMHALKNRMND